MHMSHMPICMRYTLLLQLHFKTVLSRTLSLTHARMNLNFALNTVQVLSQSDMQAIASNRVSSDFDFPGQLQGGAVKEQSVEHFEPY